MKQLACVLLMFGLTFPVISIAQDCAGDVPAHLEWCSRDHGFNEGASCGFNALAGTGVPLPAPVGQAILGNVWDRTNMMGATEMAWKAGATGQAVEAALCCQIHNPAAYQCLSSHRDVIAAWLSSK
jgi:hypothetical protein